MLKKKVFITPENLALKRHVGARVKKGENLSPS